MLNVIYLIFLVNCACSTTGLSLPKNDVLSEKCSISKRNLNEIKTIISRRNNENLKSETHCDRLMDQVSIALRSLQNDYNDKILKIKLKFQETEANMNKYEQQIAKTVDNLPYQQIELEKLLKASFTKVKTAQDLIDNELNEQTELLLMKSSFDPLIFSQNEFNILDEVSCSLANDKRVEIHTILNEIHHSITGRKISDGCDIMEKFVIINTLVNLTETVSERRLEVIKQAQDMQMKIAVGFVYNRDLESLISDSLRELKKQMDEVIQQNENLRKEVAMKAFDFSVGAIRGGTNFAEAKSALNDAKIFPRYAYRNALKKAYSCEPKHLKNVVSFADFNDKSGFETIFTKIAECNHLLDPMTLKVANELYFENLQKSQKETTIHDTPFYEKARNDIIVTEESIRTGANIVLSQKEKKADEILLRMKQNSIQQGIKDSSSYAPSMHFFHAKPLIDQDPLFKVIQKLPKGAVLHLHNSASVSSAWLIKNLTYRDDMKLCTTSNGVKIFETIVSQLCADEAIVINKQRAEAEDVEEFDKSLESLINLYTKQPEVDYPDVNTVWKCFQNMFATVRGIFSYAPTYKAYHRRLLEELYEDNVMYLEMRSGLSPIIDENGKQLSSEEVIELLIELVDDFKKDHPQFLGVKVIQTIARNSASSSVTSKMLRFVNLRKKFPDFLIGFDIVGQEDVGRTLNSYVSKLKEISQNGRFFFHAGETNGFNTEADVNLIDAILMNTKRVGHGYSLFKHPVLWNAFKELDIAIEISPISNQVLHLVQDLRNHPAAFYISENVPIVIANDDPGFWNAKGLSYDFYYAFMAFTPADAGLQVLKQLALNSLKYSALSQREGAFASVLFETSWEKFIDYVLNLSD